MLHSAHRVLRQQSDRRPKLRIFVSNLKLARFRSSMAVVPPKELSKVKFICEYDGSRYSGWAKAPTNPKKSIYEEIEQAWRKLFPTTSFLSIKSSSRTDAGVHALGQVVTIESDIIFGNVPVLSSSTSSSAHLLQAQSSNAENIQSMPRPLTKKQQKRVDRQHRKTHINSTPGTAEELYKRINSFLPEDIVFKSSKAVSLDFSAKDHSLRRMYRYEILSHPIRPAIGRNYVWYLKHSLDLDKMAKAAAMFVGTHNMASFCPNFYLPEDSSKHVKKIDQSRLIVSEDGHRVTYEVVGSSFMFRQVRNMVGMLVEVGMGKLTLEQVSTLLLGNSTVHFQGAPAQGLTLIWVEHRPEAERLENIDNIQSPPKPRNLPGEGDEISSKRIIE